jgi:hypothetical protein
VGTGRGAATTFRRHEIKGPPIVLFISDSFPSNFSSPNSILVLSILLPLIMSLVVEQTLPYTNTQLQLEDPKRWTRLLPLMRPSTKAVETSYGQPVVVDTALSGSKDVLLAAICNIGNFSSKILSESHLAAFTIEQYGKPAARAEDIAKILKKNGFTTENGVMVVRAGSKTDMRAIPGVAEVTVIGELKLDHVLSLLLAAKQEIK